MNEELQDRIINLVQKFNGLKGSELLLKLTSDNPMMDNNHIFDAIFDMIEQGDLIEIECVFPNHISKSFLVPRGTNINVVRKR